MIKLTINQDQVELEADSDMPLLWALRDFLHLTGTKYGCGIGQCGACTVHINGKAVRSCQTPVGSLSANDNIITIEGAQDSLADKVRQAWIAEDVPQCGYCQPGQIMSAIHLLRQVNTPSDEDINQYMSGNICRCGTYNRIRKAIHRAAKS